MNEEERKNLLHEREEKDRRRRRRRRRAIAATIAWESIRSSSQERHTGGKCVAGERSVRGRFQLLHKTRRTKEGKFRFHSHLSPFFPFPLRISFLPAISRVKKDTKYLVSIYAILFPYPASFVFSPLLPLLTFSIVLNRVERLIKGGGSGWQKERKEKESQDLFLASEAMETEARDAPFIIFQGGSCMLPYPRSISACGAAFACVLVKEEFPPEHTSPPP